MKNIISKNEHIVNDIDIDNYIKKNISEIDNMYYIDSYDKNIEINNNNEIIDNI